MLATAIRTEAVVLRELKLPIHRPGAEIKMLDAHALARFLRDQEGVQEAVYDLPYGCLVVQYDARRSIPQLIRAALADRIAALKASAPRPPKRLEIRIAH